MKFKFKIQQYQTDAVQNTVNVFRGQVNKSNHLYEIDLGKRAQEGLHDLTESTGYRNQDVDITPETILENIREMQRSCDIKESASLSSGVGQYANLDIEMETGTGKTYVYIKTMFELNKQYGWTKFVVVVPSIAIREGVYKSFQILQDHFMEYYKKKARFFIYKSDNLYQLDTYSNDAGINVMIINSQAFAKDMKAEVDAVTGKLKGTKAGLIIYSKRDEFQSRRPIDVLSANRPIIIMDEPQKMEGAATQNGLKNFKPLFVLNYSATHKTSHNLIYALDALDAYRQKLVKKIQVKGFSVKNLRGTNSYLYLDSIILSKNEAPKAKIELEVKTASGSIKRISRILHYGDNLERESGLIQYKGYVIDDINPLQNYVSFTNGVKLNKGEVLGDVNEEFLQRLQIRETIESHFRKEATLFAKGIKCLSLFFIDEVANYKTYKDNEEIKGRLWEVFEDEYNKALNENISLFDSDYQQYLRKLSAEDVHAGYFSIDRKGHSVNSTSDRRTGISDDISAYELILKNKERLLSLKEPVRFIFSHSALREGWDNPNVFQICTLRHANSSTAKRQEVGRGLRLCVDQEGNRMDYETLGEDVQELNKLTVVANESYASFTDALQKETREILRDRPTKADVNYFVGKCVKTDDGTHTFTKEEAESIIAYLEGNYYIDKNGNITESYKVDKQNGMLEDLPKKLRDYTESIHGLIASIYDETADLSNMVEDGNQTDTPTNELNKNFEKTEFQALWKELNHQYAYTVHYDSNELIDNVCNAISMDLNVSRLMYEVTTGEQQDVDSYKTTETQHEQARDVSPSTAKYDLVGEIAQGATLTRRTVVEILKRTSEKLIMFRNNPEEYIKNVIQIIKEQKATMIVESIQYSMTEGTYESKIFTETKHTDFKKAFQSKKHITDFVFTDGIAENSNEKKFAEALDAAKEVCVYAKLPRSFKIPTPVGNYSPDWAIAFNKGTVKHIFFVAETKGSMDSMELREIERAKINCAKKLFNDISTSKVRYHEVASYGDLLNCMQGIE